jgi:hypothetical protein
MVRGVTARISENRYRLLVVVIGFVFGIAGCDRPDTSADEGVDRQTCLGSELAPIEALAACSRFIAATNRPSLNRSDAYYGRGIHLRTWENGVTQSLILNVHSNLIQKTDGHATGSKT